MKELFKSRIASLFGPDPDEEHRRHLVAQFYSTLQVMSLAARRENRPLDPGVEAKLSALFAQDPPTWGGAYEIEQLLSQIMTPAQLDTELKRRLAEARSLGLPHVDTLAPDPQDDEDKKRTLYQRLLNDLQWFYSQRIQRRAAAKKLSVRVSAMFLSAFTFFFLVVSIQFFASPSMVVKDKIDDQLDENGSEPDGNENLEPKTDMDLSGYRG